MHGRCKQVGIKDLKNRKVVNFSIDIELLERLDKYSKQTGIPKTRVYDFALKEYLDKMEGKNA